MYFLYYENYHIYNQNILFISFSMSTFPNLSSSWSNNSYSKVSSVAILGSMIEEQDELGSTEASSNADEGLDQTNCDTRTRCIEYVRWTTPLNASNESQPGYFNASGHMSDGKSCTDMYDRTATKGLVYGSPYSQQSYSRKETRQHKSRDEDVRCRLAAHLPPCSIRSPPHWECPNSLSDIHHSRILLLPLATVPRKARDEFSFPRSANVTSPAPGALLS